MNTEKLNNWLTLGANLGVLIGLFILILEVRQNADFSRMALETAKNDQLASIELSIATPAIAAAWTKSIRAPSTMTEVEMRMVESHLVAILLQWGNMFHMEATGLTSRARTVRHIENVAPYYFGSAYGKNWWRLQMAGWKGTPMAAVAGPIIEALDPNFMIRYLDDSRLKMPIPQPN